MNVTGNSSITSSYLLLHHCINIYDAISWIRAILLLPLSTFILYLGLQKWCQHRSFKTASHFDIFTYHLAAMEFLWVLAYICQISTQHFNLTALSNVTRFIILNAMYGEILFHTLTCAERYIAVVQPITYLRMRNNCGTRIRTITIGCVWLLSFGISSLCLDTFSISSSISVLCLLGFAIIVTSFCSLSVLCVLIRPGPGERGGEKGLVDQSRQRAFYTITAISGVQWLWFLGLLATNVVGQTQLNVEIICLVRTSLGFCNVPSCLVLPLMYLQRAGKLSHN